MKKLFIILLSVTVLALVGCKSVDNEKTEADIISEETQETEENLPEKKTEHSNAKNEAESGNTHSKEAESSDISAKKETESQHVSESRENTTKRREETSESAEKQEETQEETQEHVQADEPEYTPAGYNPNNVVALAIAKCQAGGMITTQDNLANALAEGRITQEEYNEYYPYDGLENSYYSVFVETDLNKASTTSGQPLRSEDAIATYIADMLLLESNPVFNVVYVGVYSQNGTDYYEFRCLR